MPLYVYFCDVCGEKEEVQRPISARDDELLCLHKNAAVPDGEEIAKGYPMRRVVTCHNAYYMKGDNSASVTPKRFRANKKAGT